MGVMNDFVRAQIPVIADYFKAIAVEPTSQLIPSQREQSQEERVKEMAQMVRFMNNHFDEIKVRAPKDVRVVGDAEQLKDVETLLTLLATLLGKQK